VQVGGQLASDGDPAELLRVLRSSTLPLMGDVTSRDGIDELKLEAYKTALATRNMEINLFWQRSNYFLVLNTAIAVGFFSRLPSRHPHDKYAFGLAVIGIVIAVLWVRINLGSKFWQSRWEHRLHLVEKDLAPGLDLFSASDDTVRGDVRQGLEPRGDRRRNRLSVMANRLYVFFVMRKPSVSKQMTFLSALFVVVWLIAAVVSGYTAFA
jgi:hypothetical protein